MFYHLQLPIYSLLILITVATEIELNDQSFKGCKESLKFPKSLAFGTATASYQIEGAWNIDGKGESIWDNWVHQVPSPIADNSTGDIACDSYHKFEEDLYNVKTMGFSHYRFSLSWPRILPNGLTSHINQAGIDYYNRVINACIRLGITPLATIFHWDLPQALQEKGGFQSPELVKWFTDFSRLVFEKYGDRVKHWITFNEPQIFCPLSYGQETFAPGINKSGVADYLCGHYLLLAHASVYHMYQKEFKARQHGLVGITSAAFWYEPGTDSEEDKLAAERVLQFNLGWFAHPIFTKEGDYPAVFKEYIKKQSEVEGLKNSRLPSFTQKEIDSLRYSSDFFGLNHYSTYYVKYTPANPNITSSDNDAQAITYQSSSWSGTPPFLNVPWGFHKLLVWIKRNYANPNIYITECGYADATPIHDVARVKYFKDYLRELLRAIKTDGVNVTKFTAWSLMDNFEWSSGYTRRFGLYDVNFDDPQRPRTPKDSALFFKELIQTKCLHL